MGLRDNFNFFPTNPNRQLGAMAAVVIVAWTVAACGQTSTLRTKGSKEALSSCAKAPTESPYGKAKKAGRIESGKSLIADAEENIKILFKRARAAGGEIDLPTYETVTEITAGENSLSLYFYTPGEGSNREVWFQKSSEGGFNIGLGSVACQENGAIYPNGVTETLSMYVKQTTGLDVVNK